MSGSLMNGITYRLEPNLSAIEFIDVLRRSTLAERRPADDVARIESMLRNADIVVAARDEDEQLVGVARALSDFAYCTYLSDLAVSIECQRQGIGKRLIEFVRETGGEHVALILLAAPAAQQYYPHIGMDRHDSCWILPPDAG